MGALTDVIAAGKRLDADEREIAALALQHVDESEQPEVDAAWDDEIDPEAVRCGVLHGSRWR